MDLSAQFLLSVRGSSDGLGLTRTLRSCSEEYSRQIGHQMGQQLRPPQVILLSGELGAGKTVLAQALAEGIGVEDLSLVRSPSFTLVNEYPSVHGLIYHVDLYRIDKLSDLSSIGIDEILDQPAIIIIEWGEKFDLALDNTIRIRILVDPVNDERIFEIDVPDRLAG